MKSFNKELGYYGEDLAKLYLINKNYKILEKNYRVNFGEIDIIAAFENTVVFVEVKTRKNLYFGLPCEAVTNKKRYKIFQTAQYFILKNYSVDLNYRFDIIEVFINGNAYDINHLINAFWF